MKDPIERQAAIDALGERPMVWMDSDYEIAQRNQYDRDKLAIETVPSAQPEPCDDPRADVYYLAEKIGIHRLYALVVELRGEPEPCEDAVSRHRLLNDLEELTTAWKKHPVMAEQIKGVETAIGYVKTIPSVTPKAVKPEIIRCKDCKRWDDSPSSTIAPTFHRCRKFNNHHTEATDFCSYAEKREEGGK